ncbi:P-loop NTPase fold protein [Tardiphaga sp.]|uniref:KAP family P-loop NTPase fold protein n=1 Tax=Tardiphaga sp. TaxID=1926292 RepID=UPI00260CC3AA|nr:P-loop NTPase fold protein [Tardiphaga sp.]MDB5617458.1 hypothetical protein [Tardiphaga sp.]
MSEIAAVADVPDIWENDRLGRAADAAFLKLFLINRTIERKAAGQPASYVLNIDARWGQGKSFFLSRFAKMLEADKFLVAQVNAWQDDHADDPLLSVMDAIDAAVAPLVKREKKARDWWNQAKRNGAAIAVAAAKGATIQIAKKAIGSGLDEVNSILASDTSKDTEKTADDLAKALGEMIGEQGKTLLASFREGKRTISKFRESVGQFLKIAAEKGQSLPLFVLVDELDRCRPPFAIAMLERMKHLFDIDQVVFIVATDTTQLSHSIGAVYGSGFDSEGYLSRFFNRTYHFEEATRKLFVEGLLTELPIDPTNLSLPPNTDLASYLTQAFDYFTLPLRDIEQAYDILRSFVTTWNQKCKIEIVPLLPIVIAHQQKSALPLDSNFGSGINQIARRFGGPKSPWRVTFNTGDFRSRAEEVDGISLTNDFINHAVKPLSDLNREVSVVYSRWVVQRLSDEFMLLHGNSHHSGSPPFSIVLRYPEMVRSAGRLSGRKG